MVFSYLFTRDTVSFYAAAVMFGLSYGGVMPLYALVTREYFGEKVMGSAYGAVFLISTLGMASAPGPVASSTTPSAATPGSSSARPRSG